MKVVCILPIVSRYLPQPKMGEIYTVTETIHAPSEDDPRTFYRLAEFTYLNLSTGEQIECWTAKFRPIDNSFGELICKEIEEQELVIQTCEPHTT